MANKKVTSIADIKKDFEQIIEIPAFEDDKTFTVKVRKIDVWQLISSGAMPNDLMMKAVEMFNDKDLMEMEDAKAQAQYLIKAGVDKKIEAVNMFREFSKHALVEPKYEEVKDIFNSVQYEAIYAWVQGGVKDLESFRNDLKNRNNTSDSDKLSLPTIGSN